MSTDDKNSPGANGKPFVPDLESVAEGDLFMMCAAPREPHRSSCVGSSPRLSRSFKDWVEQTSSRSAVVDRVAVCLVAGFRLSLFNFRMLDFNSDAR